MEVISMEENLSAGQVNVPVTQNSLGLEKQSLGSDGDTCTVSEIKKDMVDIFKSKKTNVIRQKKSVKEGQNVGNSTSPSKNTAKHTKRGETKDGKIKKNKKSITPALSNQIGVQNSSTVEKDVTDSSVITNHIREAINSVIKNSLQTSNLKKGGERSGIRKKGSLKIKLKLKRKEKSTRVRQRKDKPDSCTSRNEIFPLGQEKENLEKEPEIADDVQQQVMKEQETTESTNLSTSLTVSQDPGPYQTVQASDDRQISLHDFKIEVNDDFVDGTDNSNDESLLNNSSENNACDKMLNSYSDSSVDLMDISYSGKDVSFPCVKSEPIENVDYLQNKSFSVEINPFYNNESV
ncbi:Hypothetical predicted protein [Mytilus galloprovincialis]|uniref:Uncharacterized protein n=1 Tax=Mytilus galloprovincialis TaxID=29158 RepID=A0A8B6BXI7_MYTGA|nr:Hypothetical predicted protein [Mytilus galloprovincialis]